MFLAPARVRRNSNESLESAAETESTSCRVCLKDGDIPIFGSVDISKHVNQFGGIEVFEDDNDPQHICDACHILLEAAIMFRETAQKSHLILMDTDYQNDSSAVEDENTDYKQVIDKILGIKPFIKKEYFQYDNSNEVEISEEDMEDLSESDTDHGSAVEDTISQDSSQDINIDVPLLEPNNRNTDSDLENETIMIIVSDKNKSNPPHLTTNIDCELCNLTFKSSEKLKEHNTDTHPQLLPHQKQCEVCFKILNEKDYRRHIKEHRKKYKVNIERKYGKVECEICGKKVSKSYISVHVKRHSTNREKADMLKKCPICKKMFSANYLNDHIQRVHPISKHDKLKQPTEEKLQCPVCDKKIKETVFQVHVASHAGPTKKYVCDQCGKVFKYPTTFKTHCLTHGGELKYQCQFCPYRGLHKALLKIHMRTHTGEYNYKCTECPAKFITKSNLSKHLTRHNGEYKLFCDVCNKGFYFKWDLEKHHRNIHSEKDIVCEVCGKKYGHRDTMLSHQLKVHGRQKLTESSGRMASYLKLEQEHEN